jgi:hypothetical protein
MVKIKNLEQARKVFKKRVEGAGPEYEFGITNPRERWDVGYESAIQRITEGIREAIEKGLLLGGVKRKGHGHWSLRTQRKGPSRWKDETPKSDGAWYDGFKPFADALAALVLEMKRRKGDPFNIDARTKPVVFTLRKRKEELRGATAS